MAGKATTIKNALKTLLTGLTDGGSPVFQAVIDSTKDEFSGYPVLRILPGHQDDEKTAVSQNDRTVNFTLLGHLELEDVVTVASAVFDRMYDLTDLVMDALDEWDFAGTLNTVDPSIETYYLDTTRGDWTTEQTKAGAVLTFSIDVQVRYTKNL